MFFYKEYFLFLKEVYKKYCLNSKQKTFLTSVIDYLNVPDKAVDPLDIGLILSELQFIENAFSHIVHNELLDLKNKLESILVLEIKANKYTYVTSPSNVLIQKWINSHPRLAYQIVKVLYEDRATLYSTNNIPFSTFRVEDSFKLLDLSYLTLKRAIQLGTVPPLSWYQNFEELQAYNNPDSLLELAFTNVGDFQALDRKYPGFLVHMVSSYEDLVTFCQLLPNTFLYLLHAPQIQKYIPSVVHYVKIWQSLHPSMSGNRSYYIQKHIKNLDELVLVTNAFPYYFRLIAAEVEYSPNLGSKFVEQPCARFIQTKADLMRLDLGQPIMQSIIDQVPRFMHLIDDFQEFADEISNRFIAPKRVRQERRNHASMFSFFYGTLDPMSRVSPDSRLITLGQVISATQFKKMQVITVMVPLNLLMKKMMVILLRKLLWAMV